MSRRVHHAGQGPRHRGAAWGLRPRGGPCVTIAGCADGDVPEIRSLGKTIASWRTEILAHHDTGASNAPPPPFTLLVALVWQCRGWLLAAVGRAVSPCHF